MGFLTKEGLQNLTNKLVQGDAIKVASHRGKNVKEVIDNIQRECENVALPNTMTLENGVNEFKVGQGRDVDVSGDVEEGKINVELQGKTWQNLCGQKITVGKYWDETDTEYSLTLPMGNGQPQIYHKLSQPLKPNTTYTLIFNFTRFNSGALHFDFRNEANNISMGNSHISDIATGIKIRKITTPSENIATKFRLFNVNGKDNDFAFKKHFIILEGDYTQTPVEELPQYFEGIQSSFEDGVVDVEVQGKNLANINTDNSKEEAKGNFFIGEVDEGKYSISLKRSNTSINYNLKLFVDGRYENIIGGQYLSKDFVTFTVHKSGILRMNAYTNGVDMSEIMLVKGTFTEATMPTFEPYYKKKISFNIGEPLRSLPNGVCDEIRNNNGQ